MAVNNPLTITWRGLAVGGTSDTYQINGSYLKEQTYERFLLVFEVQVVASSYSTLESLSDALEVAFSARMAGTETLVIDIGGNAKTYTNGQTIFNAVPQITKTGNQETDYGYTRAYRVTIAGELPEASGGGIRDFEVLVDFNASRKRVVTMRGSYFASASSDAVASYLAQFNTVADNYLDFVDNTAAWEMVQEGYTIDRNVDGSSLPKPHTCSFTRQYIESIYDQSQGLAEDPEIVDHRVTFTTTQQAPAASRRDVSQLRRCVCSFQCLVNREETTDLDALIDNKIVPYLKSEFETEFQPRVFAIEDLSKSRDRTGNAVAVQIQFAWQASGDFLIVAASQSVSYRENRFIDYTPVHGGGELDAYADVGFAVLERVWTRAVESTGVVMPQRRITASPRGDEVSPWTDDTAGQPGVDSRDGTTINEEGWNIVASTSQVTPRFHGDPTDGSLIEGAMLTEAVIERFHSKPQGNRTSSGPTTGGQGNSGPTTGGPSPPAPSGPITPGGQQ